MRRCLLQDLIIREVRLPSAPAPPPIETKLPPVKPTQPPPLVIREKPPQPPPPYSRTCKEIERLDC